MRTYAARCGAALCLAALAGTASAQTPPTRTLRNERVGYSLSYPRAWSVTVRVIATEFARGAACQSVRIVDSPTPGLEPPAKVLQSFVQLCWKRVADGLSLRQFMRRTYRGHLRGLFTTASLGGAPAYRSRGGGDTTTYFLQLRSYRLQIVAAVVAAPGRRAERRAQVRRVLTSFSPAR